jgi:hypothetical protein
MKKKDRQNRLMPISPLAGKTRIKPHPYYCGVCQLCAGFSFDYLDPGDDQETNGPTNRP